MMEKRLSTLLRVMAATLFFGFASSAQAIIINLDADPPGINDITNAVTISGLSTSDVVDITQIGTADGGLYNAWNAWGFVAGCNGAGSDCSNGWINNWSYYVDGDSSSAITVTDGVRYQTDLLALANGPAVAPITGITSISFYIADFPYTDNLGGISLDVNVSPGTPVPEPTALALFAAGLLGFGLSRRRTGK